MKHEQKFARSALAVALSLCFPAGGAMAEELEELLNPNVREFSVTAEHMNQVNPLYRLYYGQNDAGVNGSANLNYVIRNEEGRWYRAEAYNLGLSTQEFSVSAEQQGDWSIGLSYDQIPRYSPFVVNTANKGVGSRVITLPKATSAYDYVNNPVNSPTNNVNWANYQIVDPVTSEDLKTERTATSLTATKFISEKIRANFSFKNEDKKGERMFGMGERVSPSSPAVAFMYFTPEPIDSKHQQIEASLEYQSRDFQGSAGYYGSFFQNDAGNSLDVISPSGSVLPLRSRSQTVDKVTSRYYVLGDTSVALAPDNHVNQFYVAGAYNYSQDTRLNFRASHAMGVQKDNFMAVADNISGRRNLGAEVDTTNLFGSITSRFTKDLTFLASWSREDRDDDTPVVVYNTGYTNNPESTTKDFGKLELAYRLPAGFKITGGVDYDQREYKGLYEDGLRDEVNERTYRVDLKKSLSETISGKVQYSRSERTGSPWMSAYVTSGQPLGAYYAGSIQFSDRTRDKLKFFADFAPTEALNIQAAYEMSDDEYDNRTPYNGAKSGVAELYSLDAAYQFSDDWRASAWYSYSTNRVSYIKANANSTPAVISWAGKADLKGDAFGLDVSGKVLRKFDVGLQYTHSNDTGDYPMAWDNPATTTPIGVPDTEYKLDRLRLYGKYPVAKNSVLRADYIYDIRRMDDYTWKNWIYSDGTTVYVDPKQTTQIFALTLIHGF